MRKFVFFAVAALSCVCFAQEVKVTYTSVAVSAKKAIADLAQKTGMKIECSSAMDNEILILRLEDAPMDEVMKRIAAVTSGTWRKEGEISYLVSDSSARQIEANKIQQAYAAKLAASLKKQQEALSKKTKDPETSPEQAAMFGFMGGGSESMTKLAIAIGAGQLASVPSGGRVVFSTNPNGMQRSLPGSANAIISEFVVEHNKMAALVKQEEPAKVDTNEEMSAFMELFGSRMKKPKPIATTPSKALVVASRRGMFGGYTLELKLYDAAGKVLVTSSSSVMTEMPFDVAEFANPKTPPPAEGPEIKLSPLSKELSLVGNSFGFGSDAGNKKFSKELLEALKDPSERDPLSFVHSEALIAIATQRKEQLVANIPDSVTSFFGNMGPKAQLTATSFLAEIKDDATITEANGWMVVSPADPVEARKQRTNRTALRDLIRIAQTQGSASLDDLATYATKNGSPMEDAPASMMYIMVFAPNAMQQGMMGQVNWDMLRLFGLFDTTQRANLRKGGRLGFGNLTPGQQAQVTKMLFGAEQNLTVEQATRPAGKKLDPFTEMVTNQMSRFGGGGGNEADFRTEPTEVMPSGLPQSGFISVNFTSEPVGQPQTMSTDFGLGVGLGPMELGMLKVFKEDPKLSTMSGQMPTIDDIKVGTRSTYNFSFYVAPEVSSKQSLMDDSIAKDAQVYKLNNLPSDFQKKIDEMAASMKSSPFFKMMGQFGGMGSGKVLPPK